MNFFRCPTAVGPGKATHWGLGETFNIITDEIIAMFIARGIVVLPVEQWIETQDRPHVNAWHAYKNQHNFAQLTLQFVH
eukprot:8261127-Pyramimonas_sp.AAC.1